jgi:hypothetical protein
MSGVIPTNEDSLSAKIELANLLSINYEEDYLIFGIQCKISFRVESKKIFITPMFEIESKDIKSIKTIGKSFHEVQTKIRSLE